VTLPHDERGSGPVVVLLHAGIADRRMWAEHLDPLAAAGWRAIAFDLPGFGEAPAATERNEPWHDVLGALDELEIQRAVLVGSSFGGAVAQRVALTAPDRVTALVLVSSPEEGIEPSPQLQSVWEAEEEALTRGEVSAAVDTVVASWTLPDAPAQLRERIARMQARVYELQAPVAELDVPCDDPLERNPGALAGVRVPTLVLVGEHDIADFQQGADELARMLRAGEPVVIAGAGHLAPLEEPDEFRRLLLEFLAALPAT
jgi:pimeloyl-ACP methyl ester carboxylesterase